ncbi:hypothetical protein SAL_2268, partial [Streptococcus agalactiae 515]
SLIEVILSPHSLFNILKYSPYILLKNKGFVMNGYYLS